MTGERDNVRLDEWLAFQAKEMDAHLLYLTDGHIRHGMTEHQENVLLREAVVAMLNSYSILLSALAQHPNIRNLP